jgi:hypothetical protein
VGVALLAALLSMPSYALAQGVKVALLPNSQTVEPDSSFDLSIVVTRAGSSFNGFDAYIGYDPAALTLVPKSPISLQEGPYFTAACGNRFHRFQQGVDRDTITDVLLCAGVSLTGPGTIYKLRFKAAHTPQVTKVKFLPGLQFYNEGRFVNPDSSSDATIGIGLMLDARPAPSMAPLVKMIAAPNPAHGRVSLRIETDRAGWQRLLVMDLQGRIVRNLDSADYPAGMRSVSWDGRNDSGRVVPPGRYMASLRVPGRTLETRFIILR